MNKKLIIGTANFGMNYGISVNKKKLIDKDIIDILVSAEKMGIETLDTAISYGDSIERLGNVGVQKFKIISKIPRIPFDVKKPSDWYKLSVTNLIKKLNKFNVFKSKTGQAPEFNFYVLDLEYVGFNSIALVSKFTHILML